MDICVSHEKEMNVDFRKKTYFFITVLIMLAGLNGCMAPKNLDGSKIKIESMKFYDSGILEFSGRYDDGSWGVTGIRGKISGNAIVLDGMAEFWGGEESFFHRIVVPSRIKEVRFGKNVIWKREDKKPVKTAEKTAPEALFP